MIIPVILAGGTGSRLWPLSRQLNPKQFVEIAGLAGNMTLFQSTLARLEGLPNLAAPIVICNEEHRFLVAEQLRQLAVRGIRTGTGSRLLLEPAGRNTAPALTLAALLALRDGDAATLLVLPADHEVTDMQPYHDCVEQGGRLASAGWLVTFGIEPTHPETGYGYIQSGVAVAADETACRVARFVEKPDLQRAADYLATGGYYWNSGMFMMSASLWLAELDRLAPAIASACRLAFGQVDTDGDFIRVAAEEFKASPSDSIDYAVMEHTNRAAVIPLRAGWSDLGAWSALWDTHKTRDAGHNVIHGDVVCEQVTNSYVLAGSRLVAAVGLTDTVIVETADAVLVADRSKVQDVKKIVQWLEQHGRQEAVSHTLVYRPWGSYECLASGPGFQVKRIRVRPGAALSLQMHHHRAEHWIVLAGNARVTCDDRVFTLTANQSTFIPQGSRHRLENPDAQWIELIEVQSGNYLGEDDIIRFEDVYGRS
jgi:mannose-1-phosphate guanylyltransferase/mannose-6-phosphate isomerase